MRGSASRSLKAPMTRRTRSPKTVKKLKSKGMLPPEAEAKLKAAEEKIRRDGQKAEAMWQKGQAKIAEGREKIAAAKIKAQSGALPAAAKEKMLAHGIDPDKRRKLTRKRSWKSMLAAKVWTRQ